MNSSLSRFLRILFFTTCATSCLLLIQTKPAYALKMITARREGGTKGLHIGTAVERAKRNVTADRIVGPEIPPVIGTGTVLGISDTPFLYEEVGTGEIFEMDTSGGATFDTHGSGTLTGTILMAGTNVLSSDYSFSMGVLFEMEWEVNDGAPLFLDFNFSGVTYPDVPILITVEDTDHDFNSAAFHTQFPVFPTEGSNSLVIPTNTASGQLRLLFNWDFLTYDVPTGNSSVGIGQYSFQWQLVPEPTSFVTITILCLCLSVWFRRKRFMDC